jgi:hypothetical protein
MLRTALNKHPGIICKGELFNPNKQDHPYPLSVPVKEILARYLYREYPADIKSVGFVHHAYHPGVQQTWPDTRSNSRWIDIWEQLLQQPDLKVIHLRRENLLYRHISQLMARQTGHWQSYIDAETAEKEGKVYMAKPGQRPGVAVDAKLLRMDFRETLSFQRLVRDRFAGCPLLDITYEALSKNFAGECARILSFLEVPVMNLTPDLLKLEERPLSKAITNYLTLKEQFVHTEFAKFFVD